MRTTILPLLFIATFAHAWAAPQAPSVRPTPDRDAERSRSGQPIAAARSPDERKEPVMITGSHLPQTIVLVGNIPVTANPVRIITREQIDSTGATDLAAALRRSVPAMR